MTLQQLTTVKRWHSLHGRTHRVEQGVWDVVLTCWLLGWVGIPVATLLSPYAGLAACALLACSPELYLGLRKRLHRRGVLRCDWLPSAAPTH